MTISEIEMKHAKYKDMPNYPIIKDGIKKYIGNKYFLSIFSLFYTILMIIVISIITSIIYNTIDNSYMKIIYIILCFLAIIFPMCSFVGNAFKYLTIISMLKDNGYDYVCVDVNNITTPKWRKDYRPSKSNKTEHTWFNSVTYLYGFTLDNGTYIKLAEKDMIIGNYDVNEVDDATILKLSNKNKKVYIVIKGRLNEY